MRKARALHALSALLPMLVACRSMAPASAETLQQLARVRGPEPALPCLRQSCTVDVASAELSGRFEARVAACIGDHPRARMQWFPDLGAKVLDLLAAPGSVQASIPPAGIEFAHDAADGSAPRHLLYWMAVSLLEQLVPLTADRVLGAWVERGQEWLALRPLFADTEVEARLGDDGRVRERRFCHRHVHWSVTRSGGDPEVLTVEGEGFHLRVLVRSTEFEASLPDAVFAAPHRGP